MQEQFVGRNHYSGSFFSLLEEAPRYSFALGLNLVQWFVLFALFDPIRGLNAPNPFTFIQNCTLFSLRTIPQVSASDDYKGWPAYQSLVDGIVSENLGSITQSPGSYYFPVDAWSAKACDLEIMLEANNTDNSAFMFDFTNMVFNDTKFVEATSLPSEECKHLSQSDLIIFTALWILGLVIVLTIVKATCDEICKCCRRNGYENLDNRQRNRGSRLELAVEENESDGEEARAGRPRANSA